MSNFSHVVRFKYPLMGVINNQRLQNIIRVVPAMRLKSSGPSSPEEDQPLRYSTSRAGSWTARQSRVGTKAGDEIPWFQPYAISLSLGVFLLYFCVFREESDLDEELGRTLYDRISGLEKKQLEISLQYNLENGLDATAIKTRLEEIELQEEEEDS